MADDLHLAKTLAASIVGEPDLARTIVERPARTIEPSRTPSARTVAALDALKKLGATLGGRIDLHETLGEGGMGVVHLATQATLGRQVAVKTLRAGTFEPDAALRILREAWVTGALEHPNIVPVHDVGVDAHGSPVIVMKRIEGRSWSELMHNREEVARRFGTTDLVEWNLRILTGVCNAVHFAHSRGVVHRDLKPENVMIGEFGEVYLLDWGIALSLRDDPSGRLPVRSPSPEVAGTPHYMAPEMILGDSSKLSERTDVYLLGAVLYEVFSGRPPHDGPDLQAMLSQILLSSPTFAADFPAEARRVCSIAMSPDPRERYASAEELKIALEAYLRHRGSRRLADDAERSLTRLKQAIDDDSLGEEREIVVANLLGECRFGYHAALSAWPDNAVARAGLDQALLLVVLHELATGDGAAAATLLRDVSSPPADVVARVEAAVRGRATEEGRLRKMEQDYDPNVGTLTRTFLGGAFGLLWTATTLGAWLYTRKATNPSYFLLTLFPGLLSLAIGVVAYAWARETLSKTLLNRRVARTLAAYTILQSVLALGGWLAGFAWQHVHLLFIFCWGLTYTLLAIWVEVWFAALAIACALSFIVACAIPSAMYPLMAFDNLLVTFVVVRVWFPREDAVAARFRWRRRELGQRARRWLGPSAREE